MPIPTRPLPTADELHSLMLYEGETGLLYWKERPGSYRFNGARAGKRACHPGQFGYNVVTIHCRHWQAHRVIWKMMFGDDPIEVDHISGLRSDNRLHNLRCADRQRNMRNLALRRDSTSGRTGVSQTVDGTWRAYMSLRTGFQNLGHFPTFEMAAAARAEAERAHGFHENHGRPAAEGV